MLEATADPKAAAWQIPSTGPVRIAYDVDLAFARADWPYGNEQAGLWQDGALFLVSKALFIVSDTPGPRRVRIEAPAGWSVSTPWPPVEDDPREVTVASRDALLDNSLVVGRHAEHVVQAGKIRFVLALLGKARDAGRGGGRAPADRRGLPRPARRRSGTSMPWAASPSDPWA